MNFCRNFANIFMKNNTEICRICCELFQKFSEISETEKISHLSIHFSIHSLREPPWASSARGWPGSAGARLRGRGRRAGHAPSGRPRAPGWAKLAKLGKFKIYKISRILQFFGGLVLGCIKMKLCKKICVWQHFSSSTRFAYLCTAAISKFSKKIGLKNQQFSWNFSKIFANVAKIAKNSKFFQISKISAWESGRFWKMLQNAYLFAKIGADTAENERTLLKISAKFRSG